MKVTDFIRRQKEKSIYEFFANALEEKLKDYVLGNPENKPDVLEQIVELEKKIETPNNATEFIFIQMPDKGNIALSKQDVVSILTNQQNTIYALKQQIHHLQNQMKTNNHKRMVFR